MTHPCDACCHALPGRFCAKYDSRTECEEYIESCTVDGKANELAGALAGLRDSVAEELHLRALLDWLAGKLRKGIP